MRPVAGGAGGADAGGAGAGGELGALGSGDPAGPGAAPRLGTAGPRVRGGWIWGLSGVVTAAVIALPAAVLIRHAGVQGSAFATARPAGGPGETRRTFTVPQRVSALTVNSDGAMVQIRAGAVPQVRVTETVMAGTGPGGKGPGGMGAGGVAVAPGAVAGGQLTLANAACGDCAAAFTITVPAGVTADVSSQGGSVFVTGVAGATIDSGGGTVTAGQVRGPLTVFTEGGPIVVNGASGTLEADTGGGTAVVQGVSSPTADIDCEGGAAVVSFATPPRSVTVRTGGGPARIDVPGGPYALNTDSAGGLESGQIATSPSASRSLTVITDGGSLFIG